MVEIPELDTAGLRRFGLIFAAIIVVLFGLIFPWVFGFGFVWWPWIVGAVFATWSLLSPGTLRGFYTVWMRFGFVMNAVVTRVVLGTVYFLIVVPTGLILRSRGKDPMRRNIESESKSYRVESEVTEPERMRKPF